MPVNFLGDRQTQYYGRFADDPTIDQLNRYFHLDDRDRAFIAEHRGNHNRLGVAIQLGTVRFLGTFLERPSEVPSVVVAFVADQLAVSDPQIALSAYEQSAGRWRHGPRIRDRYGYRTFTDFGVAFRLNRFLYALCWTGTDRPSVLFDNAVASLLAAKILLPGLSVLERAVARVRARATDYLHRRLVEGLTREQRERLDRLVTVPEGERQSPLDRLRDGPYIQSGREISRAITRLTEVRAITEGLPSVERLPPGKIGALARFGGAAKASAVARLPDDRRAATLLSFAHTLEASAGDDVIDLFDAVSTRMFADADMAAKLARMRSLRDLDVSALKLRAAGLIVLDPEVADADVRRAIFDQIERSVFYLLGIQFSPRIADIGGARFWRVDGKADYGILDELAAHKLNMKTIAEHWDDFLRLVGSLKLGVVQAEGLTRTLQTNDRPTRLARALQEFGRLIKTLYMLRFIDDESYRRRILVQLNRGEGRHQLARTIFHGRRGELRQRYREGQEDQLGALGLVVNLVVLWNTIYMDAALDQLRAEGFDVRAEDVPRLSPLGVKHINMLGRYAFTLPDMVARGELRPLRDPTKAGVDDA